MVPRRGGRCACRTVGKEDGEGEEGVGLVLILRVWEKSVSAWTARAWGVRAAGAEAGSESAGAAADGDAESAAGPAAGFAAPSSPSADADDEGEA